MPKTKPKSKTTTLVLPGLNARKIKQIQDALGHAPEKARKKAGAVSKKAAVKKTAAQHPSGDTLQARRDALIKKMDMA